MSPIFFTVTLRAKHGDYRGLRSLLKRAWRDHRMRAIEIQERRPAVARRRRRDATQARRQGRGRKMLDMSKYAGAAFIGLDDVKDGPMRGTIATVDEGKFGRPVLTFENGFKFPLNVTNVQTLIKAWGEKSQDYIGESVELYEGTTKFEGENRRSVLVRPLPRKPDDRKKKPKPTAAAPTKAQQQPNDLNDEIPY
jgi:hypothetical protein